MTGPGTPPIFVIDGFDDVWMLEGDLYRCLTDDDVPRTLEGIHQYGEYRIFREVPNDQV